MRHPIWFHRNGRAHWVPCAWPGWALMLGYIGGMAACAQHAFHDPHHPSAATQFAIGVIVLTGLLTAVVLNTDDSRR